MKTLDRRTLIAGLTADINAQLKEAVIYQQQTDAILLKPAVDGGWSITQCLEHLNTYSAWYHPRISKVLAKPATGRISNTYQNGWLGDLFINMMKPVPGGKKYKAAVKHVPPIQLNAQSVVTEFIFNQQQMLQFLKMAEHVNMESDRIAVSIMKCLKLKLGDILQFLTVHNERHLLQARRNFISQQND